MAVAGTDNGTCAVLLLLSLAMLYSVAINQALLVNISPLFAWVVRIDRLNG